MSSADGHTRQSKFFSAFCSSPPDNLSPAISIFLRRTATLANQKSFRRFIRPRPAFFACHFYLPSADGHTRQSKFFSAFCSSPPDNLSPAISIFLRRTATLASLNSSRRFICPRPAFLPAIFIFLRWMGFYTHPIRKSPAAVHPAFVFRERGRFANMGGPPGRIKACPAGSVRIGLSQSQMGPRPSSCIPCGNPFGNCVMLPAGKNMPSVPPGRIPTAAVFSHPAADCLPASGYRQIYAAFVLPPGIPAGRGIPSPAPRESAASARCGFWRNVVY